MLFDWFMEPARKREYRKSYYYRDFLIPYRKNIIQEDSYLVYNEAKNKNLPICMIHPTNDGPDFLIHRDSIFLFPMSQDVFGGIAYNTKKRKWEVDFDGDFFPLDDEWEKYKKHIAGYVQKFPCFLLIRQCELYPCRNDDQEWSDFYALDSLPPYVRVVQQYLDVITE